MSLDNIDEKFKKVAKGFSEKNKKVDPAQEMSVDSLQEKDKYEESFDKRPVTGLLSVFENHLNPESRTSIFSTSKISMFEEMILPCICSNLAIMCFEEYFKYPQPATLMIFYINGGLDLGKLV